MSWTKRSNASEDQLGDNLVKKNQLKDEAVKKMKDCGGHYISYHLKEMISFLLAMNVVRQ